MRYVLIALTLLCGACAGAATTSAPLPRGAVQAPGPLNANGEVNASSGRASLQMTDTMKFAPNVIKVKAGQAIALELKNAGTTIHSVYAPPLGLASAVRVNGGQSGAATFTAPSQPGVYEFWCNEPGHAEAGMNGQVVVE